MLLLFADLGAGGPFFYGVSYYFLKRLLFEGIYEATIILLLSSLSD
jgi:hypothetical protein